MIDEVYTKKYSLRDMLQLSLLSEVTIFLNCKTDKIMSLMNDIIKDKVISYKNEITKMKVNNFINEHVITDVSVNSKYSYQHMDTKIHGRSEFKWSSFMTIDEVKTCKCIIKIGKHEFLLEDFDMESISFLTQAFDKGYDNITDQELEYIGGQLKLSKNDVKEKYFK